MDDDRIRRLTEEVLAQIGAAPASPSHSDLESRVSALESAVARLQSGAPAPAREADTYVHVHSHPSLQVLKVGAGSERCVVEPDKPCVQSGQCRALGH